MKTKRQAKILELIKKNNIETQEELSDYLEREGYQDVFHRRKFSVTFANMRKSKHLFSPPFLLIRTKDKSLRQ